MERILSVGCKCRNEGQKIRKVEHSRSNQDSGDTSTGDVTAIDAAATAGGAHSSSLVQVTTGQNKAHGTPTTGQARSSLGFNPTKEYEYVIGIFTCHNASGDDVYLRYWQQISIKRSGLSRSVTYIRGFPPQS